MGNPLSKDELIKKIESKEDVSNVDTSEITDMNTLFAGDMFKPSLFNQPLNNWDVSNVTNMQGMFSYDVKFNQPLNDWDVSNVENMEGMFAYALNYTGSMKKWKLSKHCNYNPYEEDLKFIEDHQIWHLFNTVEDLPIQKGRRIHEIKEDQTWKIL